MKITVEMAQAQFHYGLNFFPLGLVCDEDLASVHSIGNLDDPFPLLLLISTYSLENFGIRSSDCQSEQKKYGTCVVDSIASRFEKDSIF